MKDEQTGLTGATDIAGFKTLLRENKLKVTQPRLRVLEIISAKQRAISQPELEKLLGKETDRVTLYRILASFEEKGILHKIFDLHGTATYATCSHHCTEHKHEDQHIHFICSSCNSVICLEEISIPNIKVPKNFALQSVAVNAVGLCDKCQQ
ncbi:transcriptional repressor [Sphingobacterium sp. lm-10]|uniref:Fur family transcriptional regulator n=1 Tax=Sphingobacterium sp. lm-10 TaxID=2944904 RepID=UPI00201FF62F|nr:transcriptional repressor [Sphingobacterium sp. lm-10]MCL7987860.1 transcriptional repressor [Sphingobacterium sp. lm-10]